MQHSYSATVRYNQARDEYGRALGFIRGYEAGDALKQVAEFTVQAPTPEHALEVVYRMMNVVDGNELPVLLKVRSMSVGDVVTLSLVSTEDGDVVVEPVASWAVASFGWDILRTSTLTEPRTIEGFVGSCDCGYETEDLPLKGLVRSAMDKHFELVGETHEWERIG